MPRPVSRDQVRGFLKATKFLKFLISGQKFAMLEIKATLAKLLRKYRVMLSDPSCEPRFLLELVLKAADGIKLRLETRKW
jgi:hypothetical protein